MTRKVVLVLCLIAMVVAACGQKPTEAPPPAAATGAPSRAAAPGTRTVVRFAVSDWEAPQYEELIAAFEEEYPGIDIQVVSTNEVLGLGAITDMQVPEDAERRLLAAADVVPMSVTRETVRQGLVRDLTPLIQADGNFAADDFAVGSLESCQWDGGTWALPMSLNFRLIFFDKEAFDAVGEPYPQAGWTWDDLRAKAQALTVRRGDEVERWGFVAPFSFAYRLIESRVGPMADYGGDPVMPRFDAPEIVDAMRWYSDLHLRDGVMPYGAAVTGAEGAVMSMEETIIDNGQAAMWPDMNLLWTYRNQQGKRGVVPFPQDAPDDATTPAWAETLALSAGTTVPDAAFRWMDYLSRQARKGPGMGMEYLPARHSAIESGGALEAMDDELVVALRAALETGFMAGEPVGYEAFDAALRAVLDETAPVEAALSDAQARAEATIREQIALQAGATPAPTLVMAPVERTPVSQAATTITFIPGLGSLNLEPYRRIADRFHEEYPDIRVELKALDLSNTAAMNLPGLAAASDCFQWYSGFQDPATRAAVLALDPFLEADAALDTADFYPATVKQFTYQEQLLGLPADITPFIIEYNTALFDAAGVAYPSADWTWEEFLETAASLTVGEGETKQYGYVAEAFEASDLLLMLERLGAKPLDGSTEPPSFTYNDPSVVEAMNWYAALTTKYAVKPAYITDVTKLLGASSAYLDREVLINGGRAAMWTNSGTTAALFSGRGELEIGAAPLPARADGTSRGGMLTTSGYFISGDTPHREACWRWLTFLSAQQDAAQGLPARRSVAESDAYRGRVGESRAAAYIASVADADQPSSFQIYEEEEWMGGALFWLTQAYGKVVSGERGVEDALDEAQDLAERYRACVIAADDFGTDTWQRCVAETDPTLPAFLFDAAG